MKKTFRLFTFLLALLTLISVFFSCRKQGDENADSSGEAIDVSESEVETVDLMADVPAGSYIGYEFRVLVTAHNWATYSMTGDIGTANYSKPVYQRNQYVQTKLGITIKQDESDGKSIDDTVHTQILSSSPDNYDAIWHAVSRATTLSQEGCLYDLADATELNFDKPWWYSNYNDDIHLGDKRYILMGALNTVYHNAFGICAFNKKILDAVSPETDMYEVYNSGNWTYETMFGFMKLASFEGSGDGALDATDDNFGLTTHSNVLHQFLTSANQTVTKRNTEGYPSYQGLSSSFINAWEYIVDNLTNPNYAAIPGIKEGVSGFGGGYNYNQVFNDDRALFIIENAGDLAKSNTSGVDYGIIGYPKLNVEDPYASPVYYGVSGLCILSNNIDINRTTIILENLCAYSYGTVDTAFIENTLYYKYSKDAKSVETMKNILASGTVDISYIYEWSDMNRLLSGALKNRDRNVSSLFGGIESELNSAINKSVIYYGR